MLSWYHIQYIQSLNYKKYSAMLDIVAQTFNPSIWKVLVLLLLFFLLNSVRLHMVQWMLPCQCTYESLGGTNCIY